MPLDFVHPLPVNVFQALLPRVVSQYARNDLGMKPSLIIPRGPDVSRLVPSERGPPVPKETTKSGSSHNGNIASTSDNAVPIGLF